MAVRLIAIDLDGTLLHDDMTISDYSRQVIKKAQSRGYEIVVATGRMWDSAKAKADTLQLGDVPLICCAAGRPFAGPGFRHPSGIKKKRVECHLLHG